MGFLISYQVSLVELTVQQKDALCVLLTGRSEGEFAELIKRIVASRKLDFDMICLKPEAGPNNQQFASKSILSGFLMVVTCSLLVT